MERVRDGIKSGGIRPVDISAMFISSAEKRRRAEDVARKRELAELCLLNGQRRGHKKSQIREFVTVGEVVVRHALQSPDFKWMVNQVLASASLDEVTRKFLSSRGWL